MPGPAGQELRARRRRSAAFLLGSSKEAAEAPDGAVAKRSSSQLAARRSKASSSRASGKSSRSGTRLLQTAVRIYRIRQRRKHAQWFHRRRQRQFQNQTELMTSSQQARESLGNLTDLFTGMLGTDVAIGGATPDTAPENKLVEEIKKIISAEAASARTADMVNAKISAEKLLADYELGWTTPEDLEQAIINTLNKTLRYDSRARAIDGLPTWDIDRMYTIESLTVVSFYFHLSAV